MIFVSGILELRKEVIWLPRARSTQVHKRKETENTWRGTKITKMEFPFVGATRTGPDLSLECLKSKSQYLAINKKFYYMEVY